MSSDFSNFDFSKNDNFHEGKDVEEALKKVTVKLTDTGKTYEVTNLSHLITTGKAKIAKDSKLDEESIVAIKAFAVALIQQTQLLAKEVDYTFEGKPISLKNAKSKEKDYTSELTSLDELQETALIAQNIFLNKCTTFGPIFQELQDESAFNNSKEKLLKALGEKIKGAGIEFSCGEYTKLEDINDPYDFILNHSDLSDNLKNTIVGALQQAVKDEAKAVGGKIKDILGKQKDNPEEALRQINEQTKGIIEKLKSLKGILDGGVQSLFETSEETDYLLAFINEQHSDISLPNTLKSGSYNDAIKALLPLKEFTPEAKLIQVLSSWDPSASSLKQHLLDSGLDFPLTIKGQRIEKTDIESNPYKVIKDLGIVLDADFQDRISARAEKIAKDESAKLAEALKRGKKEEIENAFSEDAYEELKNIAQVYDLGQLHEHEDAKHIFAFLKAIGRLKDLSVEEGKIDSALVNQYNAILNPPDPEEGVSSTISVVQVEPKEVTLDELNHFMNTWEPAIFSSITSEKTFKSSFYGSFLKTETDKDLPIQLPGGTVVKPSDPGNLYTILSQVPGIKRSGKFQVYLENLVKHVSSKLSNPDQITEEEYQELELLDDYIFEAGIQNPSPVFIGNVEAISKYAQEKREDRLKLKCAKKLNVAPKAADLSTAISSWEPESKSLLEHLGVNEAGLASGISDPATKGSVIAAIKDRFEREIGALLPILQKGEKESDLSDFEAALTSDIKKKLENYAAALLLVDEGALDGKFDSLMFYAKVYKESGLTSLSKCTSLSANPHERENTFKAIRWYTDESYSADVKDFAFEAMTILYRKRKEQTTPEQRLHLAKKLNKLPESITGSSENIMFYNTMRSELDQNFQPIRQQLLNIQAQDEGNQANLLEKLVDHLLNKKQNISTDEFEVMMTLIENLPIKDNFELYEKLSTYFFESEHQSEHQSFYDHLENQLKEYLDSSESIDWEKLTPKHFLFLNPSAKGGQDSAQSIKTWLEKLADYKMPAFYADHLAEAIGSSSIPEIKDLDNNYLYKLLQQLKVIPRKDIKTLIQEMSSDAHFDQFQKEFEKLDTLISNRRFFTTKAVIESTLKEFDGCSLLTRAEAEIVAHAVMLDSINPKPQASFQRLLQYAESTSVPISIRTMAHVEWLIQAQDVEGKHFIDELLKIPLELTDDQLERLYYRVPETVALNVNEEQFKHLKALLGLSDLHIEQSDVKDLGSLIAFTMFKKLFGDKNFEEKEQFAAAWKSLKDLRLVFGDDLLSKIHAKNSTNYIEQIKNALFKFIISADKDINGQELLLTLDAEDFSLLTPLDKELDSRMVNGILASLVETNYPVDHIDILFEALTSYQPQRIEELKKLLASTELEDNYLKGLLFERCKHVDKNLDDLIIDYSEKAHNNSDRPNVFNVFDRIIRLRDIKTLDEINEFAKGILNDREPNSFPPAEVASLPPTDRQLLMLCRLKEYDLDSDVDAGHLLSALAPENQPYPRIRNLAREVYLSLVSVDEFNVESVKRELLKSKKPLDAFTLLSLAKECEDLPAELTDEQVQTLADRYSCQEELEGKTSFQEVLGIIANKRFESLITKSANDDAAESFTKPKEIKALMELEDKELLSTEQVHTIKTYSLNLYIMLFKQGFYDKTPFFSEAEDLMLMDKIESHLLQLPAEEQNTKKWIQHALRRNSIKRLEFARKYNDYKADNSTLLKALAMPPKQFYDNSDKTYLVVCLKELANHKFPPEDVKKLFKAITKDGANVERLKAILEGVDPKDSNYLVYLLKKLCDEKVEDEEFLPWLQGVLSDYNPNEKVAERQAAIDVGKVEGSDGKPLELASNTSRTEEDFLQKYKPVLGACNAFIEALKEMYLDLEEDIQEKNDTSIGVREESGHSGKASFDDASEPLTPMQELENTLKGLLGENFKNHPLYGQAKLEYAMYLLELGNAEQAKQQLKEIFENEKFPFELKRAAALEAFSRELFEESSASYALMIQFIHQDEDE